ncbi:MAG: ATP-binding protein [Anaerolineaceae bacterium]
MRTRLILAFVVVILVALGTVLLVADYSTETQVHGYLRRSTIGVSGEQLSSLEEYYRVNSSWEGIAALLEEGNVGESQGQGKGQAGGQGVGGGSRAISSLADQKGTILYAQDVNQLGTTLTSDELETAHPIEVNGEIVGYLSTPNALADLPSNFESQLIEKVSDATLTAAFVSVAVALVLAVILANQVVKPVRVLTQASEKMASGDLSQRVSVKSYAEVNTLGSTLNSMAESLQISESSRRALTADIAHELRTPLAVQKVNLEALEDGVYPLNLEALKPIREQNELLIRLVEDLRILALADSGELTLNKRSLDLMELCLSITKRFEAVLAVNGIIIQTFCQPNLPRVMADPDRIEQILHNLLQNAQRYAPANSVIEIHASQDKESEVLLEIRDHGPGIPPDQLEKVFERFYCVDSSRKRESGSTGLGLAIARKLAEAHGGTLTAHNHPQGGAVFSLRLPV